MGFKIEKEAKTQSPVQPTGDKYQVIAYDLSQSSIIASGVQPKDLFYSEDIVDVSYNGLMDITQKLKVRVNETERLKTESSYMEQLEKSKQPDAPTETKDFNLENPI